MKVKEIYDKIMKYRQWDSAQEIYDEIWKIDRKLYDDYLSNTRDNKYSCPDKYIYLSDDDKDLLLDYKYENIYLYGVCAWIDFMYQDTESYSNNMTLYNQLVLDMACEFRRNNRSKRDYQINF